MEFSVFFDIIQMKNDPKRKLLLAIGYLIQFFSGLLFLPNAIAFYQSCVVDFDMDLALESLIFVCGHFMINTQFYSAIWNRSNLKELSIYLTKEINEKKNTASGQFYLKMDKLNFLLRNWFSALMFILSLVLVIPPPCIIIVKLLRNDEIIFENLKLSMPIYLPFAIKSASSYLLVILLSAVCLWSLVSCKTVTAEIFYRYGLHIFARCKDLQLQLENLSLLNLKQRKDPKSSKNVQAKLVQQLKEIITTHDKLLDFFSRYALVTSGIIFFEFSTSFLLLIASGGSIVNTSPLSGDLSSIKFNLVVMCAISSIFITSLMGDTISYKFAEIPYDAYSTGWEGWPPAHRKYIYMILTLLQRPRYLYGFGLWKCDLNTFTQIIKSVISFILFLKEV